MVHFHILLLALMEVKYLAACTLTLPKRPILMLKFICGYDKSEVANGLDPILFSTVKNWIENEWPFKNPAYPIREISLEKWMAMK